jgi:hypothetical protein
MLHAVVRQHFDVEGINCCLHGGFAAELLIQTVLACLQPFGFAGFFGKGPLSALILRRDGGIDGLAGDGADGVGGGFVATAAGSAARAAFTSSDMTTVMVAREERMSFMVGQTPITGMRPTLKRCMAMKAAMASTAMKTSKPPLAGQRAWVVNLTPRLRMTPTTAAVMAVRRR